ncbi:hypothetical protein B0H17DRAFT_1133013 [Mycena rosella]|uniref:Uncharacterized protein n=1 Tax=Mycena rosella TaxID=1033263 RepID=A0AAD7GFJ0_MYCRO|nr:hypothetical protein B0H17DRAFT_1133013 [Mycena rosella]
MTPTRSARPADYLAHNTTRVPNATSGVRLDVVYILTKERTAWLADLGERVFGARRGGADVGMHMAVNMDVARRAAVFVGMRCVLFLWSSFTSDVLFTRLVNGREARTARFL